MNTPTNQVRNILMNELGLTKEVVRQATFDVITHVVNKELKKLLDSGEVSRIVTREFEKLLKDEQSYSSHNIRDIVIGAAKAQAGEFIRENVKFNLTIN